MILSVLALCLVAVGVSSHPVAVSHQSMYKDDGMVYGHHDWHGDGWKHDGWNHNGWKDHDGHGWHGVHVSHWPAYGYGNHHGDWNKGWGYGWKGGNGGWKSWPSALTYGQSHWGKWGNTHSGYKTYQTHP